MKQKHLLAVLFAGILYLNSFAQPAITAQKTIGGSSGDQLRSGFWLTKDGGLIAGGSSESSISGEKTEDTRGGTDYWIVKLNKTRKIEWDKTIGGSDNDDLLSLQQTSDGGYILGGYSESNISGEKKQKSRGGADYWIVKLDNSANIQWSKTIGGSDVDVLEAVYETYDGGYILGGWSRSNISGEKTENSRGSWDYWVVKLNNKGNVQWDKTIGGSGDEFLHTLQQTSDGGYIIGGVSLSNISGEKTENSRGFYDYWVVKLNSKGNIQWDKTIGGTSDEELYSLQQTCDRGYILGGLSSSNISGEKTENNRGGEDFWVVKLNSLGNIQWDKTIGGSDDDGLSSLQQTSDSGYILSGWSDSNISGEKSENSRGNSDYWVVKLNQKGKYQWDKSVGGSGEDDCWIIKEIKKNHYVVAGSSPSEISGDKTQKSRGSSDYWIVWLQYQKPAAIAASSSENLQSSLLKNNRKFSAYPNPAKDRVNITTNGNAIISLTDQLGKIILTKTIEGNGVISVAALPAGLYYLKNNATGETQKIILAK